MSANDQQAMIRSMVDRLDKRLAANGDDLDGWLRLARARNVLGETDAARQALTRAETHFKGDTAALEQIAAFRKTLQLD
jgi:cytochrome c-type biogenesis protein CcmH